MASAWAAKGPGTVPASRGVGPEVDDAPAESVQGDTEGEESELVLLARQAGQQRGLPAALAPAAGQPEQAASHQVGGEVFLGEAAAWSGGGAAAGVSGAGTAGAAAPARGAGVSAAAASRAASAAATPRARCSRMRRIRPSSAAV